MQLGDSELVELLALLRAADTAELKLTVPDEGRTGWRSTVAALDLDPINASIRQVFFFDTPGLELDRAGVVVRARRTHGKPDDSVIKLRPVEPEDLDDEMRSRDGFGVEVDALPGGFVCSASLKAKIGEGRVRTAALGDASPASLFNDAQRELYAEHAPDGIALDDLSVLGPVLVLKLKSSPPGATRRLVSELWLYPDGTRILELSTKCAPGEAFQVAAETRAYLAERGVSLTGEQQTKTRTALEFFAGLEAG